MSFPIMRSTLALLALVLACACGDAGALDAGAQKQLDAARDAAEQARADADAAAAKIASLQEQMDDLEGDVGEARRKLRARLEGMAARLAKSVERLRATLGEVESGAATAGANADAAVARAAEIARDLAVLEQRYNYHLRRYHGGG